MTDTRTDAERLLQIAKRDTLTAVCTKCGWFATVPLDFDGRHPGCDYFACGNTWIDAADIRAIAELARRAEERERLVAVLTAEHEAATDIAYFLRRNPEMVVTLHVEGERGSITLGPVIRRRILAAHDAAEEVLSRA